MSTEELLRAAINELCLHCGQYKEGHLGTCDGCRWYGLNEVRKETVEQKEESVSESAGRSDT